MANLFRRAGSYIAKFIQSSGDPAAVAGQAFLYAKDSGGTTKLFMRDSAGAIAEVGGGASPVVASTILVAPASTISVSGLDGDTDREYEIEFNYLATGTGAHDVDIRPNGDTGTNRQTTRVYNGSPGAAFVHNGGTVIANGAVTGAVSIRATFKCFVDRDPTITYYRRFLGASNLAFDSGAGTGIWESSTTYASNVSNLTSIAFGITNVQFAIGSELIVRKVVR